ncbi:hypothetical protein AWJ20_3761 [Sugiyamaella lignohabitans]|uniref:Uncharacterized protein n=1 Tax=Sugiyamaella lignohabitans TaxID=796027 RepID=A0A161HGL0_9ASCO|nr:uncharacterized protein AWJ20_3761 [Sugiyamaella lignohabitans]ANB10967.1 hypothetical protein AWJ20_3761 [Sugiyamaella lignohabitans]
MSVLTTYPDTLLIMARRGKVAPEVGSEIMIRISAPVTRRRHRRRPNLSKNPPKASSTCLGSKVKTAVKLMKMWLRSVLEVSTISRASRMSVMRRLASEIRYDGVEISSLIRPGVTIPLVKNLLSEDEFLATAS